MPLDPDLPPSNGLLAASSLRAPQRRLAAALALAAVLGLALSSVQAQDTKWPTKPVKLVVPYAVGGGVDRTARIVAERLGSALGQQIVVDNKPGGGTVIAAEQVAKSDPDGHTLLIVAPAVLTVNPGLYPSLPYKPDDLVPVAMIGRIPLFVATAADASVRSLGELVAKGQRQEMTYASAGNGSMTHLGAELMKMQLGMKLVHVPYKGTAALLPDVLAGRVDFALVDLGPTKGLIDSGKLKILGAASAAKSVLVPTAPSMTDAGVKGVDVATWVGLAAPRGTPDEVLRRLASEVGAMLADNAVQQNLLQAGVEPTPMSMQAFGQLVSEERARWAAVIKAGSITPN